MRIFSFFFLMIVTTTSFAFSPQVGTWIINEENTGKPGRGFQIDVQAGVMALYFYGYEQSGAPNYYVAAAPLQNQRFVAPLGTYSRGAFFGSPPRDAQYEGSAGVVELQFDTGTTGSIKLPNESWKPIQRFYYGYQAYPEALLGERTVVFQIGNTTFAEVFDLSYIGPATPDGNGLVLSSNSRKACEYQISGGAAGFIICVVLNSFQEPTDSFALLAKGNDLEGVWMSPTTGSLYYARGLLSTLPDGRSTGILPLLSNGLPDLNISKSSPHEADDHIKHLEDDLKRQIEATYIGAKNDEIRIGNVIVNQDIISSSVQALIEKME